MTQALALNSCLITDRGRVLTHKHEWCSNVWNIIPSTVGNWQGSKRLEDLQRCIAQGRVGGSDPFLAGCVSLLSGACWPIIHSTNLHALAIHLEPQRLWSLTPICCCSCSLDGLGSPQLTTASTAGRNPKLSCTEALWLLLPFDSSYELPCKARIWHPELQLLNSIYSHLHMICHMELRHHIVVKGEEWCGGVKNTPIGSKSCFNIFVGLFTFAVHKEWEQRNFWVCVWQTHTRCTGLLMWIWLSFTMAIYWLMLGSSSSQLCFFWCWFLVRGLLRAQKLLSTIACGKMQFTSTGKTFCYQDNREQVLKSPKRVLCC